MIGYTIQDIMFEGPCPPYTSDHVEELWAGRASLSPRDIASLDIGTIDKIWILSRLLFRLSRARANRVARLIALDVVNVVDRSNCPDIVWWYLVSGDKSAAYYAWSAYGDIETGYAWYIVVVVRDAARYDRPALDYVACDAARYFDGYARYVALDRYLEIILRAWEVH